MNGAEAVFVDYDDLPSVTDPLQAIAPGAPVLCDAAPDNIAAEMRHGDAAAAEAAFKAAAHVVSLDIVNQRLAPASMEPRVVLAETDAASGRITITLSSQMPTAVRDGVAGALGLDKEQVRVLVGDVGGGFGMKTGLYPEDIVVAHAARTLGRPVKWCAQRLEEFSASVHGRDVITKAELALDANGKVLALRTRSYANVGGYAMTVGVVIQLLIGPWVTTSIYDIPTISLHAHRGDDQHHADRCLPRRRAARGDLHRRAADGRRRARDEDRRRRAAPPQHDPPGADALHEPDGAGLRRRPVREDARPGPGARRLERLRGTPCRVEGEGPAARPRHRHLPRVDRRQCAVRAGDGQRAVRRHRRADRGDHADGPGHQHQPGAAGRRHLRRAARADPHPPWRHRPRQRLRQRRFALAVHRRRGGAGGVREHHQACEGPGRRGARSGAARHRVPRRALHHRRHRPRHRPVRAGRQAAGGAHHVRQATPLPARRAGRTPATSARSRSTPTPARWRSPPTPRSTTSAASSARPSCAGRSRAVRCRASARRCASRSSTTATAASC